MTLRNVTLPAALAFLFAIALQVQGSLFATPAYEGLRVSLGDAMLPVAGLVILASLLRGKSLWPAWDKPFGLWAPALMSTAILLALLNGYYVQGGFSAWAWLNKGLGWIVLMAYLLLGTWLGNNGRPRDIILFVKTFCFFFCAIAFAVILLRLTILSAPIESRMMIPLYMQGLMGNRNAYAFLMACTAALLTLFTFRKPGLFPRWLLPVFWALYGLALMFNASRTLWICTALLAAVFLVMDWKKTLRFIIPALVAGVLIFNLGASGYYKQFAEAPYRSTRTLYKFIYGTDDPFIEARIHSTGDKNRLAIIKDCIDLIKQYPLQGAGLGTALYTQAQKHGKRVDIVDNTSLWILTEMGLIGLAVFLSSYGSMALSLKRKSRAGGEEENRIFTSAALLILMNFAVFCLFHEILYTRFLWFILGFALAKNRMRI